MLVGSIEAGGTKFVCAIGDEDYRIIDQIVIPTTTPAETLKKVVDYFLSFDIEALAIASFGPIEIRKNSEKYGFITSTPKKDWSNTDVLGELKKHFNIPFSWTTDVNGSAYGEYVLSMLYNDKISSLVYYTVGTGIGAGAVVNGQFLGSSGHPEMGHTFVKRHHDDIEFPGVCPYHDDCLEGVARGPSIEKRKNVRGENISDDDPVWDLEAFYLAQSAVQATLIIRPDRIIFGGGVTNESLIKKIREQFLKQINGYLKFSDIDTYITQPKVTNNSSATIGNFALGLQETRK
ncbi:MAG: fructokinase ScrK [Enterococcus sp.]